MNVGAVDRDVVYEMYDQNLHQEEGLNNIIDNLQSTVPFTR